MAEFGAFLDGVAAGLIAAFEDGSHAAHIAPTIRHALRFQTWVDLEDQGLEDAAKVDLVSHWLCCPEVV
jgi:hypothetical protein